MKTKKHEKIIKLLIQTLFWLGIWLVLSVAISAPIILPGPISVIKKMSLLIIDDFFWILLANSFFRIIIGLTIGIILGLTLAILAFLNKYIEWIINPFINLIKTSPVAALIILLLIWFNANQISIVLVMLVVMPNIYLNVYNELLDQDKNIDQMLDVFNVSLLKRLKYYYAIKAFKSVYKSIPFAIGFAWKSGISGEIISQAKQTLGNQIYLSKVYLETDNLFAYIILLVFFASFFEKVIMLIIRRFKWKFIK